MAGTLAASSGTGLTSADKLLKDFYTGVLVSQLNKSHPLLELMQKSNRKFTGRAVVFPVDTAHDQGVQAVGEGLAQPDVVASAPAEARVTSKLVQATMELTDEIIASAKDDRGAFADALKYQMGKSMDTAKEDVNRQLYGDGTGTLTLVDGAVADTTASQNITVDSTRHLKAGMRVRIGTTAQVASSGSGDNQIIVSITSATVFVCTNQAGALADNDLIVRGKSGSTAYNNEISGLEAIIGTGDFQGVTVADFPDWKATVNSNSGTARPLTLDLMIQVADDIKNASGKDPNAMFMHTSVRREYAALLLADVRYTQSNQETKLLGGFVKLNFAAGGGIADIYVDRQCTYKTIYYVHTPDLQRFVKQDWGWRQEDGKVLAKVPGYNKYSAQYQAQLNVGALCRNSHGKLTDITATLTANGG